MKKIFFPFRSLAVLLFEFALRPSELNRAKMKAEFKDEIEAKLKEARYLLGTDTDEEEIYMKLRDVFK